MRVFLLILSVAAILCSCTSGTRSVKEAGGMSAEDLARQETFDPATLPDKFVVPPPGQLPDIEFRFFLRQAT